MTDTLKAAHTAYRHLLRQHVAACKGTAQELTQQVGRVLSEGGTTNGLETALKDAKSHASQAADMLERIEAEHFRGDKDDG